MIRLTSKFFLLVVIAATFLNVTVSSSTVTEKDLVSEILQAIKGQNELQGIARYLNMSHDALVKELPLESSGK